MAKTAVHIPVLTVTITSRRSSLLVLEQTTNDAFQDANVFDWFSKKFTSVSADDVA